MYLCVKEKSLKKNDMEEASDRELLERMRAGDTGALGILYMRYAPSVSDFAYRFIRVKEDIDDITHNIFCSLWENRESLHDVDSLKAYLFSMTRNAIFKAFRHRRIVTDYENSVREENGEGFSDGERVVTTADLLEMIDLLVARMPEPQRTAFRMSRYENMTYAEIAEKMGISPKTVQYYISQALAELRKAAEVMLVFASFDSLSF